MKTYSFEIPEPLMGFLATYKASWTDQAKRYVAFKNKVRLLANVAGIPDELDSSSTAEISLSIHWKKKARVDSVNVYKAIEDGIFKRDRRVLHGSFRARENLKEEKAFVLLTVETLLS